MSRSGVDRRSGLLGPESFFPLDHSNELVSATPDRSHETGIFGLVVEGLAELVNGSVQAVVEVDERIYGPEAVTELFAGYYLPRPFEKDLEDVEGSIL
jgi:hypothetical protein